MESPFATWMNRLALEQPTQAPQKDPPNALMSHLAAKGYAHEAEIAQSLQTPQTQFVQIDAQSHNEQTAQTLAAMHQGIDVISQGRLELAPFAGYADFLIKQSHLADQPPSRLGDYHYEVWDTKLASSTKPAFIIQLCCYIEMIEHIQGIRPEWFQCILGKGQVDRFKTCDFFDYYLHLKSNFLNQQAHFSPDNRPDPTDSKSWGDWSQAAQDILISQDHLSQIANISKGQIKTIQQAGIQSLDALVTTHLDALPAMNKEVFKRLKVQAQLQQETKLQQSVNGQHSPCFQIIVPADGGQTGLALLPPHTTMDVFFDIEGYPLADGGLEYLWGCVYYTDSEVDCPAENTHDRAFKEFWAHNQTQEQQAFQDFIQWVYQRWQTNPAMHIYHYAHYEIAACQKLMGRYGVCEFEVDQLLRNEVFVDLYKIVKTGLIIGEPRYSIKNVEHLYRGQRQTQVGSGGDSVVVYEQWRTLHASGEQGNTWQTSSILNDIRDYNIDDCYSTQELVIWLRKQQTQHNITYLGQRDLIEPEIKVEITERTQLRDQLISQARQEKNSQPVQACVTENMAWWLEFHRREAKPVFWRLFTRLSLTHVDLYDDLDCLAQCSRTDKLAFKPTARARNLAYEYSFDRAQAFKGSHNSLYVLGEESAPGKRLEVKFLPDVSDLGGGIIVVTSKNPPPDYMSLVPNEYVHPEPIPTAIQTQAQAYADGLLDDCAIVQFLKRAKPRITQHNGGAIAPSNHPTECLQQIIHAIQHLDRSYLPIQGPPGAGKSYTGKHVIAELVKTGAKVGITSNSHKAINHLLLTTAQYCQQHTIAATFACTQDTDAALIKAGVQIIKNNQIAQQVQPQCVIGTTAWGFARQDLVNQFDYLFVDEAGQVAVANLIAMSQAATNLILMGDQMQLGQPSQGTHPAESGLSILDYLLHESPTIADDMGVFLGTTYRMHSKINQFISRYIYDAKLKAHAHNDTRFIEVPQDNAGYITTTAGIVFVPVEHVGNTQAADEEVAMIISIIDSLIGRTLHRGDATNPTRPIQLEDILCVAPYNHQVSKLKIALGEQAQVGSVDKFQGQEAPIVILSLCASDANESPRGMEFLFDKHRLNVAISRAQCLAIVVGNPGLATTAVNRVSQMRLVNMINGIMQ